MKLRIIAVPVGTAITTYLKSAVYNTGINNS